MLCFLRYERIKLQEGLVLDELDMRIVEEMQADAHRSSRQIAKKLGVAPSTVQRHINKLIKNDVMHIVALPNWASLGYQVWVVIMLNVKHGWAKKVADTLLKYPACYSISETLGRFDIHIGAHFRSVDELTEFVSVELPKIEGIERTETALLNWPRRYYDFTWEHPDTNF